MLKLGSILMSIKHLNFLLLVVWSFLQLALAQVPVLLSVSYLQFGELWICEGEIGGSTFFSLDLPLTRSLNE